MATRTTSAAKPTPKQQAQIRAAKAALAEAARALANAQKALAKAQKALTAALASSPGGPPKINT